MFFFVSILLLGFVGGFAIGAANSGPWRRRLLLIWAALPLGAYLLVFIGLLGASVDWREAFSWFMIGLLGFVGLPMLLFAGCSVLGFVVAPAPKRARRMKNERLLQ